MIDLQPFEHVAEAQEIATLVEERKRSLQSDILGIQKSISRVETLMQNSEDGGQTTRLLRPVLSDLQRALDASTLVRECACTFHIHGWHYAGHNSHDDLWIVQCTQCQTVYKRRLE